VACAARGERLGIAAALVSIPTLFNVLFRVVGIAAFAIGVMIYGF
jgi:hypothetical protein